MRVIPPFAAAALIGSGVQLATAASQTPLEINGWYPCSASTPDQYPSAGSPSFECAEVRVPLCHNGVCESEKEIELFVRRLLADPAKKQEGGTRKALWLLQGGPGASSVDMEGHMKLLWQLLGETVDVYTTDHRGTGRSNFLECKAAQAFAQGSPAGVDPDFTEVPNCVRDILFEIENKTEAFSVTSAAKDMEYLTGSLYSTDVHTYVYGVSYGSYFTERIMHLAPKHVKGYIIDGVVPEDNPSFTTTNPDRVPPAERLAKACEDDKFCSSKFTKEIKAAENLHAAWLATYDTIDNAAPGTNKCADLLRTSSPGMAPSLGLRGALGQFAPDMGKRIVIPAIFYRLNRCDDTDVTFLNAALGGEADSSQSSVQNNTTPAPTTPGPAVYDQVSETSTFLESLIKASEMWAVPSPSWEDELKEYKKGLLPANMSTDYSWYCFFTASFNDPACTDLKANHPEIDFSKIDTPKYTYKPDAYWHKFATIPEHASVLVINGKMDFQTVSDGGVREYENLKGNAVQKMMVEFEYGGHGVGISPSTFSDISGCGYQIIASFVAQDGNTQKVNTTCMDFLPKIDFEDLNALRTVIPELTSVEEFYENDSSATNDGGDESSTGSEADGMASSSKNHKSHYHHHKHHKHHHKHQYPNGNVRRSYF